ncbi:MAG: lipopolysaccharide kinase InaA family protein [Candidatus Bathyarchaeota archaeon]|jgi:tRNA A-37 threonylcarbamoyl transferase component Bud32
MTIQLNENMKEHVLELCRDIADSRQIAAVCIYGPWVCGYADEKTDVNVLLVLEKFTPRVNTYFESVDGVNFSILTVNCLDFERDVRAGWLGEFFSEKVTGPYEPLKNGEYLRLNEVKTKKRTIVELLENLILEFPESSHEFLIKKEYFMYEFMMRRARLFPSLTYSFLNMSKRNLRRKNIEAIMDGYLEALDELEKEKILFRSDNYIKITRSHIAAVKRRKSRLPLFLKSIQRIAIPHLLSVYSKTVSSLIQDQRIFIDNHKKIDSDGLVSTLEDPKKYVLLPTPLGPVSLSDKSGIEDVARKIIPDGELSKMQVKNIGGVLNDVYLLTLTKNGEEQKFVVKRFRDWSNLKWLSLTLWSFGTTSFAVLGQSRLEKEYAINKLLQSNGFVVPKIFYISPQKRLIFEDFIEGEKLAETVKRIFSANKTAADVALVKEVGRRIAEAHSLGVSLGDCKPENFIVSKEDEIVLLDLEQATRDGNQAWDIAEFLYYSGHHSPSMVSTNAASIIAKNFLEGYLEAGGKKETVKKAASARYTKVFSVFTPPHILLAISNICQKMGKEQAENED